MPEPFYNSNVPLEPYFGNDASELHPISQSPLTEPGISSATVSVSDLDDWKNVWHEMHYEHGDEGPEEEGLDGEWICYRTIPGKESEFEDFPGKRTRGTVMRR